MTSGPGFVDFDPVSTQTLSFSAPSASGQQQQVAGVLCPGTPVTFVEGGNLAKIRLELDEKQLLLENYATHIPPRRPRTPQPQPEDQP
jgi:hypothetical protein